jgi:aspartokinase
VPQEDVRSGATTSELEATNEPVASEFQATSGETSEQVLNAMENNEVELDRILTSIKEETINLDYIEEKNKLNAEEYEHVVKTGPIDPAQKYKLWKGFFY